MYQIVCGYCDSHFEFTTQNEKPEICPKCNSSLDGLPVKTLETGPEKVSTATHERITGLELTYSKTGEIIHLENINKVILGREAFGNTVLGKIPQISRKHCSIEINDGKFIINDLGSINGTFVGFERHDCKLNRDLPVSENGIIFLGKEMFSVKFIYSGNSTSINQSIDPEPVHKNPSAQESRYRCRSCGAIVKKSDSENRLCPECNAYGMIDQI